jgi:hypothetical protein
MANTLDGGSFKEVWSQEMRGLHPKLDVFRAIASFKEQAGLKNGDKVNLPYSGSVWSEAYTRGTAITAHDLTNANEYLTVDVQRTCMFYIDDLDQLQTTYENAVIYAKLSREALGNFVDGDVLGEVLNADSSVDDGDLGGTDGNGIALTTTNVLKVFTKAQLKLQELNVFNQGDYFAVISPYFENTLLEYLAGKESALGDSTGQNGHIGKFMGFDLYRSNNLTYSFDIVFTDVGVAIDTLVINGITLTWIATLGTTDGNVNVNNSAAAEATNLYNAFNAPSTDIAETATTGYVGIAATTLAGAWDGISATNGTSGTCHVILSGHGKVTVTDGLTNASVTAATNIEHEMFGKKGAVEVVIQADSPIRTAEVSDKIGKNYIPYVLYGLKTTDRGDSELVDVQIRRDAA